MKYISPRPPMPKHSWTDDCSMDGSNLNLDRESFLEPPTYSASFTHLKYKPSKTKWILETTIHHKVILSSFHDHHDRIFYDRDSSRDTKIENQLFIGRSDVRIRLDFKRSRIWPPTNQSLPFQQRIRTCLITWSSSANQKSSTISDTFFRQWSLRRLGICQQRN